jgi:thiol-disulfide isomerase/thioredoxin
MSHRFSRFEVTLHGVLLLSAFIFIIIYWNLADSADGLSDSTIAVGDLPWKEQVDRHQLILFVSPTCAYCDQSMPFYTLLSGEVAAQRARGVPLSFLAVMNSSESRRAQEHIFALHAISLDTLITATLSDIGVNHVPTVALLNADGHQVTTWTGLLGDQEEKSVLSQLTSVGMPR